MLEEEAKERQRGGQGGVLLMEIIPEATEPMVAREHAATLFNTNGRYVQDALPMYEAEARERQRLNALTNQPQNVERIPYLESKENGKARDLAAKAFGTNGHCGKNSRK